MRLGHIAVYSHKINQTMSCETYGDDSVRIFLLGSDTALSYIRMHVCYEINF
jgi:hypothetical protein